MVKLTPAQQADFVRAEPDVFQAIRGGWGKGGATQVLLENARRSDVEPALLAAWRNTAPKRLIRRFEAE